MASIFSRIIAGEIPSYKLYEDEYVYAFLDVFPQQKGHTLIVPKIEIDHFADVPEPHYSAIFQAAKKLSKPLQEVTGCKRICTVFAGYEVPHTHYHLVPTNSQEDLHFKKTEQASAEELAALQKSILAIL